MSRDPKRAAQFAAASARAGLARLLGELRHQPTAVELKLAPVCNLRCVHCNVWKNRRDPEALSTREWLSVVSQLPEVSSRPFVSIGQGEPLLEPELFEVLEAARAVGACTGFNTNGVLISDKTAARLAECGVNFVFVSLDGLTDETHDRGRGVAGTREKAVAGLRRLLKLPRRPTVMLLTIVAGHNAGELAGLARWARQEGLDGIRFQPLIKMGDGWSGLWPRETAPVLAALDELRRLKADGWPILDSYAHLEAMKRYFQDPAAEHPEAACKSVRRLIVDGKGDVRLCRYMAPVGNVRRQTLREIWRGAAARERTREIAGCHKSCILLACHYRDPLKEQLSQMSRLVADALVGSLRPGPAP